VYTFTTPTKVATAVKKLKWKQNTTYKKLGQKKTTTDYRSIYTIYITCGSDIHRVWKKRVYGFFNISLTSLDLFS